MAYETYRVEIMPWERVDKAYVFEGPNGRVSLSELFARPRASWSSTARRGAWLAPPPVTVKAAAAKQKDNHEDYQQEVHNFLQTR